MKGFTFQIKCYSIGKSSILARGKTRVLTIDPLFTREVDYVNDLADR